nr:unnamed protein product [Spirometra erinaceieuropaei]
MRSWSGACDQGDLERRWLDRPPAHHLQHEALPATMQGATSLICCLTVLEFWRIRRCFDQLVKGLYVCAWGCLNEKTENRSEERTVF